jgi:hypothetical protein
MPPTFVEGELVMEILIFVSGIAILLLALLEVSLGEGGLSIRFKRIRTML